MKNKLKSRIKRLFLNTTVKLESFDPTFSSFRFNCLPLTNFPVAHEK